MMDRGELYNAIHGEHEAASGQDLLDMQKDCGIPNLPTQLTYTLRNAVCGLGQRAYDWKDKPHRLLYDACGEIERMAAMIAKGDTPK